MKYEAWIRTQRFDERALNEVLSHYRATLVARDAAAEAIEADLDAQGVTGLRSPTTSIAWPPTGGVTELGGLTLASEVCDWRRFPTAGILMGLTPSEYSSGERTSRGGITHAGNAQLRTQLVEAAWAYKSKPNVGAVVKKRHQGLDPAVIARAWAA